MSLLGLVLFLDAATPCPTCPVLDEGFDPGFWGRFSLGGGIVHTEDLETAGGASQRVIGSSGALAGDIALGYAPAWWVGIGASGHFLFNGGAVLKRGSEQTRVDGGYSALGLTAAFFPVRHLDLSVAPFLGWAFAEYGDTSGAKHLNGPALGVRFGTDRRVLGATLIGLGLHVNVSPWLFGSTDETTVAGGLSPLPTKHAGWAATFALVGSVWQN
jgi:hypothetical protein